MKLLNLSFAKTSSYLALTAWVSPKILAEVGKGNYVTEEPGKGFLRVVAAPKPIDIVEIESIRTLADAGQIVIACGGGGIPVIEQNRHLQGASAVIEKDTIAGKLAADLSADVLLILTSVPEVYKNFGKENQEAIRQMNASEAKDYIRAGEFEATSMLPKIEAALEFLEKKIMLNYWDMIKTFLLLIVKIL